MQLDTTTRTLEFLLGGNVTTNQLPFVTCYADVSTTAAAVLAAQNGVSNNSTAVTITAAPGSNLVRKVNTINIYNADTVSATVTVRYNDNNTTRILCKTALASGSTLMWSQAEGWFVMDTNGNRLVPTSSGGDGNQTAWTFKGNDTNATAAPTYFNYGINSQSGAGYTVQTSDFGKLVSVSNASAQTLTLPSTPPSNGWFFDAENTGAGTWTVSRNGNNIDGGTNNPTLTTNQGIRIFTDGSSYFTQRGVGGAAPNITFLTPTTGTSSGTTVSTAAADEVTWSISGLTSQDEIEMTGTIEATTQQTTGWTIRSGTTVLWRPDNQAVIPAGQIIAFRVIIRQSQQSATVVLAEGDISLMNGAGVYANTYGAAQSLVGVWSAPASWQGSWTLSFHFLGQTSGGTAGWSVKALKRAGQ